MANGNGCRAKVGPKKRHPNRSFWTKTSFPLMLDGRRKEVRCPKDIRRRATSSSSTNKIGAKDSSRSRKAQIFGREEGLSAAPPRWESATSGVLDVESFF